MPSTYRRTLVSWISGITVSGKVLDIGGNIWSTKGYYKDAGVEVYKTLGLESNADMGVDITQDLIYFTYDHIFCLEVMQFVINPLAALRNIRNALEPNGKAYISFHLKHAPMKGEDYFRYTPKGIRKLLEMVGLKIEEFTEAMGGYYFVICSRR